MPRDAISPLLEKTPSCKWEQSLQNFVIEGRRVNSSGPVAHPASFFWHKTRAGCVRSRPFCIWLLLIPSEERRGGLRCQKDCFSDRLWAGVGTRSGKGRSMPAYETATLAFQAAQIEISRDRKIGNQPAFW